MRSSDLSDADADGFRIDTDSHGETRRRARRRRWTVRAIIDAVPPVTIALTSLLAATLFVLFDTLRALDGASGAQRPTEFFASATIQHAEPEARLAAAPGRPREPGAPAQTVLSEIGPRAIGAYGLAFVVTAITLRRRRPGGPGNADADLQSVIGAVPFGIARWSEEGEMTACNARYRASLGDDTETSPHYHEAIKRLMRGGYVKLVSDGDAGRMIELHREDGTCLLIDERPLDSGGFVTMVSDVSEQKRIDALLSAIRDEQRLLARRYHEEKLKAEAASRSKTNFLAHLSHDIRTPLNHIIGFAELIGQQTYGPVGDARYLDYVRSIKSSGEHLRDSFATILDLAEFEGGQKALRAEPVALDEVLAGIAGRFSAQAGRAGVRLDLGEPSGVTLSGDRFCLTRMVSNVVENALRFTPAGGSVTIAAFAATDGVVVEVSDTGLGMSEERLDSLSQPFALGDATFTREGIGPGLGIPIARAIAELSGGRMAIDSSPALGTTVAFSLPLRGGAEAKAQAAA